MRKLAGSLIVAMAAATAALPARAQQPGLIRGSFAFFDRNLTVEVTGEGRGVLHVVRGGDDRVEVTARTERGTPAFAMTGSGRDRLRLSGVGAAHEYVVVVPEDVRLEVVLPGEPGAMPAASEPGATYRWPASRPREVYLPATGGGAMLAYDYPASPAVLIVEDLSAVRRIGLRMGEERFRIASSQPVEITQNGAGAAVVHAAATPLELVVELPAGLREFVLVAGGREAVEVRDGVVRIRCSPATRQVLRDGRQWVDLSPVRGRLECAGGA